MRWLYCKMKRCECDCREGSAESRAESGVKRPSSASQPTDAAHFTSLRFTQSAAAAARNSRRETADGRPQRYNSLHVFLSLFLFHLFLFSSISSSSLYSPQFFIRFIVGFINYYRLVFERFYWTNALNITSYPKFYGDSQSPFNFAFINF